MAAPLVIDSFSTNQSALSLTFPPAGTSASSSISGQGILGTERDLQITLTSGVIAGNTMNAAVSNGFLSYSQDATIAGLLNCQWDGADNSSALAATGLGGIDLTVGGTQDALQLDVFFDDLPVTATWTIYSDATHASLANLSIPGLIFSNNSFIVPLSAFTPLLGTGANFTTVGAITMRVGSTITAPDLVLDLLQTTATLTATMTVNLANDVANDGNANPGDTLHYTVMIADRADSAAQGTANLDFTLAAGPDATLVSGSVVTTSGVVVTGNGGQDKTVAVHLNSLADSASVKIEFDVIINASIGQGIAKISRQGNVTSSTLAIVTDDPSTAPSADATSIAVVAAPILSATMRDALGTDVNNDGMFNPGDSLVYTVKVTNTGNQAASGLIFAATLDANTTLVPGSVATSAGTVQMGNGGSDSTVSVALDPLAGAGTTATLTFEVRLPATAQRPASGVVLASGTITDGGELMLQTDDPDTAAPVDATATEVVIASTPVTPSGPGDAPSGKEALGGGGFSCAIGRSPEPPNLLLFLLLMAAGGALYRRRRMSVSGGCAIR